MVRLKDIAEELGLTVSTVSKALNHSREISQETSELVRKKAREMGYSVKRSPRRAERTIGVILPEVDSQYYARLMNALNQKIHDCGFKMISMLTSEYAADVMPAVDHLSKYDPDGMIICCGTTLSESVYQGILEHGIPSLLINDSSVSVPIDSICFEPEQGMILALEYLLHMGHSQIGYLGEYNSDPRYDAFCKFMKQNGIGVENRFIKRGAVRFEEGGYQLGLDFLNEKELPTAIVAGYDQMAIGAMKAFRDHGIIVPRDISIIGFDNIVMDDYLLVPLTSVTNPSEQMGITAVKILLNAIRNPKTHVVQNVTLQSRLIERESVKNIAGSVR